VTIHCDGAGRRASPGIGQGRGRGRCGRLGNVGDGNILAAAGIPSLQYGAGDIRTYKEWPTPDERVHTR